MCGDHGLRAKRQPASQDRADIARVGQLVKAQQAQRAAELALGVQELFGQQALSSLTLTLAPPQVASRLPGQIHEELQARMATYAAVTGRLRRRGRGQSRRRCRWQDWPAVGARQARRWRC